MPLNGFINTEKFFDERNNPMPKVNITDNTSNNTQNRTHNQNELIKLFGKDLLSMLGQGPIKKDPKKSEESLRKQKEKNEKPLTPEMEKEIQELF